jgi:hypothetical protein
LILTSHIGPLFGAALSFATAILRPLERECPQVAHRGIWRRRSKVVAFGLTALKQELLIFSSAAFFESAT